MDVAPKQESEADIDIVLRMMEKDLEGLRLLLQVHGPRVKGFIERTYGNVLFEGEAGDVLYRAAYKAWERAETFDERKGKLGPWFLGIAQREVQNIFRERKWGKGGQRVALEDAAEEIESLADCKKVDDSESREISSAFEEEVEKLPRLEREIIQADLASGSGVANSPVLAGRLNSTPGAIRVLRSRARKRLREALVRRGFNLKTWREEQ